MERGVEHGHHRDLAAERVPARTDAGQAWAVVERGQRLQRLDRVDDGVVDERRHGESRAAVHDAVADGVDGRRVPGQLDCAPDRGGMVAFTHGVGSLGQRAAGGRRRARLDGQEAELHRRRPAVQRQHVHPRTSIQMHALIFTIPSQE